MKKLLLCCLVVISSAASLSPQAAQELPRIINAEPFCYAVMDFQVSQMLVPDKIGVFLEEVRKQGLFPKTQSGVFLIDYDTPLISGEKGQGWGFGFKIAADAEVRPPLLKKTFAYPLIATIIYRGPFETSNNAYNVLVPFLEEEGYEVVGPTVEIWSGDPDRDKPEDLKTEIILPVRKAKEPG
jgi:effector-binding domain-containing protein